MGDGGRPQLNVLGTPLEVCCKKPMTGFYRDGYYNTGPMDTGTHTVCSEMTDSFLSFSAWAGNDLITPVPAYDFPGLKAGDFWCLCARRWLRPSRPGMPQNLVAARISKPCRSCGAIKEYALDDS